MSVYCAFIRHGDYLQMPQTPSAWQPFPLNKNGEKQAQQGAVKLASLLSKYSCMLDPVVDCSNLLRAWQTADIFSKHLRDYFPSAPEINSCDALAERSVGSAANLSIQQIEAVLAADPRFESPPKNWKSDSHYCLPLQGAESLMQAGNRVETHVRDWCNKSAKENHLKLFFGHGAAFRHAAFNLGIFNFEKIAALSMYHAEPILFKVDNGEFTHIDGNWKVRQKSDTAID